MSRPGTYYEEAGAKMAREYWRHLPEGRANAADVMAGVEVFISIVILTIAVKTEQPNPREFSANMLAVMGDNAFERLTAAVSNMEGNVFRPRGNDDV